MKNVFISKGTRKKLLLASVRDKCPQPSDANNMHRPLARTNQQLHPALEEAIALYVTNARAPSC